MTTNEPLNPDADRAAFFIAKGRELGMADAAILRLANVLLDVTLDELPPDARALAALGIGLFDTDDDYDDFRAELRDALQG
jgi:hypothetical protein